MLDSVAWFTFDPCLSSPELCFTPDNMTVTCEGFEHRLALGSVGFSRGVHYWEFTIDRFDADTDPSFGVARLDVAKEEMLGKCAGVRLTATMVMWLKPRTIDTARPCVVCHARFTVPLVFIRVFAISLQAKTNSGGACTLTSRGLGSCTAAITNNGVMAVSKWDQQSAYS